MLVSTSLLYALKDMHVICICWFHTSGETVRLQLKAVSIRAFMSTCYCFSFCYYIEEDSESAIGRVIARLASRHEFSRFRGQNFVRLLRGIVFSTCVLRSTDIPMYTGFVQWVKLGLCLGWYCLPYCCSLPMVAKQSPRLWSSMSVKQRK